VYRHTGGRRHAERREIHRLYQGILQIGVAFHTFDGAITTERSTCSRAAPSTWRRLPHGVGAWMSRPCLPPLQQHWLSSTGGSRRGFACAAEEPGRA
jgi:hypothetical protein